MNDDPVNQSAESNAGQENDKPDQNQFKGPKTKRKVGKGILFGAFGTLLLGAGFSVHSWPSLPIAMAGAVCLAQYTRIQLETRHFERPKPRNWALIICATALAVWAIVFFSEPRPTTDLSSNPAGLLVPANEPTPEIAYDTELEALHPAAYDSLKHRHWAQDNLPPGYLKVPKNELVVLFGPLMISTPDADFSVLRLYGRNLVRLSRIGSGIAVSTDIFGEDGKIMAVVSSNRFQVSVKNAALFDRPDSHSLIVYDDKKHPVLSVRYINRQTLKITGDFRTEGKYPVLVNEKEIKFGSIVLGPGRCLHLEGDRLLEWPALLGRNFRPYAVTHRAQDGWAFSLVKIDNRFVAVAINSNNIVYPLVTISTTNSFATALTFRYKENPK